MGLVSVSFRRHTPKEIMDSMLAAGLSCVEWGSDVHAPCRDPEALAEIAALQREYGITCSSYGTYFRLGQTPIEELTDYIRAARILGTDILRLWCGAKSGADMTQKEREELLEQSRRAADIAQQNHVTFCMECHRGTFTERPKDAVALMQAVNSPHFRMYWQPFQWLEKQESLEVAKAVSPYTEHIHVFHWKGEERLPLREGIREWREYLTAFSTPRTLLLEFMPDDCRDTLKAEATALKTIVGETI